MYINVKLYSLLLFNNIIIVIVVTYFEALGGFICVFFGLENKLVGLSLDFKSCRKKAGFSLVLIETTQLF